MVIKPVAAWDIGIRALSLLGVLASLLFAGGCTSKRVFPETPPGWHSPSYSVVFGRLQQLPPKNEDATPIWVVQIGLPDETYAGELALSPPEKLLGYSGGERVELHGSLRNDPVSPDYPGKWFQIDSVQMWVNKR